GAPGKNRLVTVFERLRLRARLRLRKVSIFPNLNPNLNLNLNPNLNLNLNPNLNLNQLEVIGKAGISCRQILSGL
ncbi:MAG: hypothetical protein PHE10_06395, partial [Kiritimatiellae bacterium]|nr:hypothetical protein [Kiritimatiellia bacterium]